MGSHQIGYQFKAAVLQVSILGPLFFLYILLIYQKKLPPQLNSLQMKHPFFVARDTNISANELNKDSELISEWACKWKASFNPDKNKQAQEVFFSRKQSKPKDPQLLFNKTPVTYSSSQKHLGIILDENLIFTNHINVKIEKAGIGINVIKILNNIFPRQALLTFYRSFIRPRLDYGDVIYDQPNNESFCQTIESVQCKAAFPIIGAIKETSQAKLCKELDLETLKYRRWCRRLSIIYKVKTSGLPLYLSKYIRKRNHSYNTRLNEGGLKIYHGRTDVLKYSFLPYAISKWKKLDLQIRKANSLLSFKNVLLK